MTNPSVTLAVGDKVVQAGPVKDADVAKVAAQALARPPTFSGGRASQLTDEITAFCLLLNDHNVTSYLEIGARHGDTFHFVMSNLPAGSRGLAIDLPGGLWGRKNTGKYLRKAINDLNRRGYRCKMLLGDSGSKAVIKAAAKHAPYGCALIDGDHRYEGVKRDWENYGGMAKAVAFHDIVGHGQSTAGGRIAVQVPRLWAEIRTEDSIELVAEGSTMGIGVTPGLGVRKQRFAASLGVSAEAPKLILPAGVKA